MVKASRRKIYIWYVTLIGFCGTYFFIQILQLGVHNSLPAVEARPKLLSNPISSTKFPEIIPTELLESESDERTLNVTTNPAMFKPKTTTTASPPSKVITEKVSKDQSGVVSVPATKLRVVSPAKKATVVGKKKRRPPIINYFKSLKDPKLYTEVVNPHEFKFLTHPKDLCKNHPKLYILSVVHSAPNNTVNRNTIRETWGNKSLYPKFRILTLFFLGTTDDKKLMSRMYNESALYGDMVIQDYHDSYRNLTYKAMSWLQWSATYCPDVSFVLKTDDDTFVNLVQFTKLMKRYEKALHGKPSKEVICQKRVNHRVFRKKDFKWNVFQKEYSDDIYPPHCPGFAVIVGRDAIPVLHNASYYVPFFWIDDVYFTGLLTARTNTRIINISSRYKSMKNSKDLVNGSAIFSYTFRSDNRLHSYWKALEDRYHFT